VIETYKGDCRDESLWIPDGAADLVLTDLPYGNIKGLELGGWDQESTDWDETLPPSDIFNIANRILRKNGKLALFSMEPYSSQLVTGALPNLPFNYRMIWQKENFANPLLCNKAPVSYYEDILLFSKKHDLQNLHPLRSYAREVLEYIGLLKKEIFKRVGGRADHFLRWDSPQFALCTPETYDIITEEFMLDCMPGYTHYEELRSQDALFKEATRSVFNLWEGKAYKSNILYYARDMDGYHPTQKPVALLKDLILTYTDPGDTVVDLTMGSGSTAVACIETGRKFYGIEKTQRHYETSQKRIADALLLK